MVGRTWFVTEESLLTHKLKVTEETASPERIQNILKNRSLDASSSDELNGLISQLNEFPAEAVLPESTASSVVNSRDLSREDSRYFSIRSITVAILVVVLIGAVTLGITLFGPDKHLSVNLPAPASQSATAQGIAVVGSSGSATTDALEKQKIQNSFSDQVNVQADESGTAGVIRPVFKSTPSNEFMYVLVPVKDKKNTTVGGQ
jgi:hypothetical protein